MKLLVEHRSNANLGDTAMIEGAVARLLHALPEWDIHVREAPGLRADLWAYPRVHRECQYEAGYLGADALSALFRRRGVRRVAEYWNRLAFRTTIGGMGRIFSAGALPLSEHTMKETGARNLKEYCKRFDGLYLAGQSGLTDVFWDCCFQQCCLILAFAEQRKPIAMTGQQLGPFRDRAYRSLAFRTLHAIDFVGLREPTRSVIACRDAGLPASRFEVMGDDSFGMPEAPEEDVLSFLHALGIKEGQFLAVNVRFAYYAREHHIHFRKLAALFDTLGETAGMPIVFVPISFNAVDSDIHTGKALGQAMRSRHVHMADDGTVTAPLVKGVMGKAAGAVCVSYHACTFALCQGVPAVCLYDGDYYRQKAMGLCGFWNDDRLALDLKECASLEAAHRILHTLQDRELRKALKSRSSTAIQRWQAIFDQRIPQVFERNDGK
jgi:polysaccharide pyruvyl transferase WcaK-like protein